MQFQIVQRDAIQNIEFLSSLTCPLQIRLNFRSEQSHGNSITSGYFPQEGGPVLPPLQKKRKSTPVEKWKM